MNKKLTLFLLLSIQPSLASFNQKIDTLQNEQALTKKQSYITVVDGYIRNEQKQLDNHKIVPSAVNQIVLLYYFNFFDNIQEIGNSTIHDNKVTLCSYPEMETFLSGSSTLNVWIWNSEKSIYESYITSQQSTVSDLYRSLCYCHEKKRLFSGHLTGFIKIWDISDLQNPCFLSLIKPHSSAVTSLYYDSQENILFSGSSDKTIGIMTWKSKDTDNLELEILERFYVQSTHKRGPTYLEYDRIRKILFWGELFGKEIRIYTYNTNSKNSRLKWTANIKINSVLSLLEIGYNPNTQRLSCGGTNGILQIFDVSNLEKCSLIQTIKWTEQAALSTLYCSPQNHLLFCANASGDIKIYNVLDPKKCELIKHLKSDTVQPSSLAYNSTRNFFFCGYYGGLIKVWGVK